ncbi:MAG: isoprenyl transferase [Verrucomicrobia bacterium]|nr:isoprenyl transferase [Verrucomicrobiota bacterium]
MSKQTTAQDAEGACAKVPRHVAIIMDGNGRWARKRGLPRLKGHEEGASSVRCAIQCCRNYGVEYLTLYAFSVENWVRPPSEIRGLMQLLRRFLKEDEHELHEHEVRLRVIGRMQDLPRLVQSGLNRVMKATEHYTKGQLILALSYGGRSEIADAVRQIAEKVKSGALDPARVDESTVAEHLYAPDVPDPDLMIRTSGEMRLSNFLLWELSYSEFYVTDVLWPDFREEQFAAAMDAYARRQRRFGDVGSKAVC